MISAWEVGHGMSHGGPTGYGNGAAQFAGSNPNQAAQWNNAFGEIFLSRVTVEFLDSNTQGTGLLYYNTEIMTISIVLIRKFHYI